MSQPCGCCGGIQKVTPQAEWNQPFLSAISYRAGTYATFLETMLARLSNLYLDIPATDGSGAINRIYPLQQLTTRETSDFSIALLDAWAVVADVLTFYQERIANEGYLGTAKELQSLLELAGLVGYRLRPGVSASVYLAFTVASGFEGTIPAGTRAQSVPSGGGSPQYFETSVDLDARDTWNDIGVRLTRPQIIAPGGVWGIDPSSLHTLYAQGLSTSLKPGDGLIISTSDFPGAQTLRLVDSVTPQNADNYTEVVLRDTADLSTVAAVEQRYLTEAGILFPDSDIAAQVSAILSASLGQGGTPDLGQLAQLQSIAETRNFTRLEAWLSDLINDLNAFSTQTAAAVNVPPVKASTSPTSSWLNNLGDIVGALAAPRSLQPANAIQLVRSVSQTFAPQSDIAPQLLAAFNPAAASTLYQAWGNIALAPENITVYAARAKAGIFANAFAGAVSVVQTQTGPPNPGTTTSTTVTPPVLYDAVRDLVLPSNNALTAVPLDAVYDQIRVGSWVAIDRLNSDNSTRTTTLHQVTGVQTVSRETATAPASGSTPAPTGFSAKVTQLTLNPNWLSDITDANTFVATLNSIYPLRGTAIYAQAEELALAEEPLDRDVEGNTIELDGLYDGLQAGRWIIVSGQRTDITNAAGVSTSGVTASELVMIAAVAQGGPGQQACMPFSTSGTPFEDVYYITPPDDAGDLLVVGTPSKILPEILKQLPAQTAPGHQPICGDFQLAPGLYTYAYLPTAAEAQGIFTDFADNLVDPKGGGLFPQGTIPMSRLGGDTPVWAWRISGITNPTDTIHTTLALANSLAYKYDSGSVTIYGNVVNATNGQTTGEVLGNGDSSETFQSFALHQSPVTYISAATPAGAQSTLSVTVNEIEWQEADNFAELGPNDHEFVTQTDDSGVTTVVFGNGEYGALPPTGTGNVKAVYRYGMGSAGNVDAGAISQLATMPLGAQGVTNPLPATGGADADSVTQARANIPIATLALDRLVAVEDYANFSRNYAGIGKAASAKLSNGRQQVVHVTIAGAEDIPIDTTSDLYNNLVQALQQFGDPYQPIAVGVRKLKVLVITAGFQVAPDYQFEDVEPNVQAALLAYFSFDQRQLGQSAFLSEAISVIQGVPGVAFTNVTVFDSVADDVTAAQLAALAGTLQLRPFVRVNLASVDTSSAPATFRPAEIAYLDPYIPGTLILTEITATNPGPLPNKRTRAVTVRRSIQYSKPSFRAGGIG